MAKVRKAVITAAGWGTRFLPATKAQPKEMLPLIDKPMIQYAIEEAVASGIEQIVIVTALGKRAIEDHFDRSFELEYVLEHRGHKKLLEGVRSISELANIYYIRQKEQLGLGHAVLITEELIGDEPFAVLLPDDITQARVPVMKQAINLYQRFQCSVLTVQKVPRDKIPAYGIIEPKQIEERVYQVLRVVEKPHPDSAPSNLAVVGRYVLTPEIFPMLKAIPLDRKRELQLADGFELLLQQQPMYAFEYEGRRHDVGTPVSFLKASVELALGRSDIGDDFRQYLKNLQLSDFNPEG